MPDELAQKDVKDTEELARFRAAWKAEVQQRRTAPTTAEPPLSPPRGVASTSPREDATPAATGPSILSERKAGPSSRPSQVPSSFTSTHISNSLSRAIDIYRSAVQHEAEGQLDIALRSYQQAFKLDAHVDKAYNKEEARLAALSAATPASSALGNAGNHATSTHAQPRSAHKKTPSAVGAAEEVEKASKASKAAAQALAQGHTASMGSALLMQILADFPPAMAFEADNEEEGVPLRTLPEELLVFVLLKLDPTTIERFAAISRKARVVTLDSAIWRNLVLNTYTPPQIPSDESVDNIIEHYDADYRRVYIERPRLRLDGVYIAVCHYVRSGYSENPWVNVSHLITYHRYLRFFPNGQVISLLAGEDKEPQEVISLLKPSLRMKGFFIGEWALVDSTVYVTNLKDPSGSVSRYSFQMTLALRSRPLGRWNRLDLDEYDSVDTETGYATPLALKHERPFWFSKVRSYAGA